MLLAARRQLPDGDDELALLVQLVLQGLGQQARLNLRGEGVEGLGLLPFFVSFLNGGFCNIEDISTVSTSSTDRNSLYTASKSSSLQTRWTRNERWRTFSLTTLSVLWNSGVRMSRPR